MNIQNTPRSIKICIWNANGLRIARNELAVFIDKHDIDVVLISETRLKNNHLDPKIHGFSLYRTDRANGQSGGGTAIYVRKSIKHFAIPSAQTEHLENTGVTIFTSRCQIQFFACYNPPSKSLLADDLNVIFNPFQTVIAAGDFNAKHSEWGCRASNTRGRSLKDYADRNNVTIMAPDEPTHYHPSSGTSDILDIAVIKNVPMELDLLVSDDLDSDHNPVIMSLGELNADVPATELTSIQWGKFANLLKENSSSIPTIFNTVELESAVTVFTNDINHAISSATKLSKTPRSRNHVPDDIINLIRAKNRARRLAHRSGLRAHKTLANKLTNDVRYSLIDLRNEQWETKLESINDSPTNDLWRMTKALRSNHAPIPPIQGPQGLVFTDEDKTATFADSFELQCRPNFTHADLDHVEMVESATSHFCNLEDDSELLPTSPTELHELIQALQVRKAAGPDRVSNRALKNLPKKMIAALANIINAMLRLRHFPSQWKNATVIFIPKPGKSPKFPQNYRPISLLSSVSKIAEKVILNRLLSETTSNNILLKEQFGFRRYHSTTDQIVRVTENISTSFSWNQCTAAVFLDVSKAFDTVWHDGLIYKMHSFGLSLGITKLIRSFLTERTFRAKIQNALSNPRYIEAGVPQGSVLSPTLYSIFTSDIPKTPTTTLAMYADDTAILARSLRPHLATAKLQDSIDQLESWLRLWRIDVNPEKSAAILFSRKRVAPHGQIQMFDRVIPWSNQTKYLGVMLDHKLSFTHHIEYAISNAKKSIGSLHPLTCRRSKLSIRNKLLIYKAIIRPIMTYSSPAWSHAPRSHINKLQIVQNKFLRTAFAAPWFVRNVQLHREANIKPIREFLKSAAVKYFDRAESHANPLIRDATDYDETIQPKPKRPRMALFLLD